MMKFYVMCDVWHQSSIFGFTIGAWGFQQFHWDNMPFVVRATPFCGVFSEK